MIDLLAQLPNPSTDWTALGIQGIVGAIAITMLRWFMGKNDAGLKELKDEQGMMRREISDAVTRLGRENADANAKLYRQLSESNDRYGKAHLMLILAMHQVDDTLKAQAKGLIVEIDDAQKSRDKEK